MVEDNTSIANQLLEAIPNFVDRPDAAEADLCRTFKEATERLKADRYDLIILDLKDDGDAYHSIGGDPVGLKVFEELKKNRFVPVVFYTAHPNWVRDLQTSYVRVVEKTETIEKVKEEVRRVLATRLPALARRVEEVQRTYMWDFVSAHWKDFQQPADQADVAYLLARRLAIALEAEAGKLAAEIGGASEIPAAPRKAHPMVMYVVPSMGPHPLAGDIVSEVFEGVEMYWLILTPSCDFAQTKANHVTLAKCERLVDREEFKNWSQKKDASAIQRLESLIGDGRGDRFKFLPRAFFIPDLVVDFQQLRTLGFESLKNFKQVATLDSPFAESVVARFSRYFNRLGTPDLDKAVVINRLPVKVDKPKVDNTPDASGEAK